MQSDCQIYVDPEEDEVFFGCMSEKEKSICAKLVNHAVPNVEDDRKVNGLDENVDVEDGVKERLGNEQSNETNQEKLIGNDSTPDTTNTSVELEHNYSTPMKHKIDKSILATPKSIVKADKDGGFLKVLSEIALVKAEAEGDSKKEDEDKENKLVPEIKITEATPEKGAVASPPNVISNELRRFRIIYNSPQKEDNLSHSAKTFENERNMINKRLDQEVLGSSRRKSVDLIDFTEQTTKEPETGVSDVITLTDSPEKVKETSHERPPVRFSRDARKVVEVLKKSAGVDESLNLTIPEIDVEEEENSFLSPESGPSLDETIVVKPSPKPERIEMRSKTEVKQTGVTSQNKVKYFSERKICNEVGNDVKKCVKRLPLDERRCASAEKVNGSHQPPPSRIPVLGAKNSKIRLFEKVTRTPHPKATPSNKSIKSSKFNHIESPINAYIHNKPTALVLNVKPEVKKENVAKVWKAQTNGNGRKQPKEQSNANNTIKLPFVEYKSATPYKIEKRGESRLPRLAPSVYKLIGTNSPKVLRHEGRFYLNSPRKENSKESTIVADQNEVSIVVSQPALKSHTIK